MDTKAWHEYRQRTKAFAETDLGKLYNHAIRDTESYWVLDSQETVSDKRLRDTSDKMNESQKALAETLMKLAGV